MKSTKSTISITKNSPILVIGFGSIGQRHYRNLISLGYENVSVYDVDKNKLTDLGGKAVHDISLRSLSFFSVVFICNPSYLHVATALLVAKAGCHMFIEKPLAISMKDISLLEKEVRTKKVKVMVACNYRFHPGYQMLEKDLKESMLGKPISVRTVIGLDVTKSRAGVDYRKIYVADPKMGGGVIFDSGVHAIDYLSALFGEVKEARTMSGNSGTLGIKSEDHAHSLLRFTSGVRGTLTLDYFGKPKQHEIEVLCENGLLRLDLVTNTLEWYDSIQQKMKQKQFYLNQSKEDARNDQFLKEVGYFFDVIRGIKKPISDIAHAKRVTEALLVMRKK